ncbi:hypothetical protein FRC18_004456 [Serendipita sp. 400]|nr:hypothetical protein FRC18_004456 [Serendipita sp. 400]
MALTSTESTRLSILYGINGTSIYSQLSSIRFPNSFPVDFMHLLENIMEALVLLWTGNFKGLDEGIHEYTIEKTVWEAIGKATEAASSHLPAAFGRRLPDISQDRTYYTAEAWLIWTTLLARPLLYQRFKHICYFDHFVRLVELFTQCMDWEMDIQKVEGIRAGIAQWVQDFERIYYQYDANRLPVCTLQFHMLLHVADTILDAGPVWVYWVFVMERLCRRLQRSVTSRRHPYASMNTWVIEWEQLKLVKNRFGLSDVFHPNSAMGSNPTFFPDYPLSGLLRPRTIKTLSTDHHQRLVAAIGTKYDVSSKSIQNIIPQQIACWNRLRRVGGGDLLRVASAVKRTSGEHRNNSYVRYVLYVDIYARQRRREPAFEPRTYFGCLEEIYEVLLPAQPPFEAEVKVLLLALIRPCDAMFNSQMNAYTYRNYKPLEVVDIQTIESVVGRVPYGNGWAIVDRSGELARATLVASGSEVSDD